MRFQDSLLERAISDGWFRIGGIDVVLPSGRTFRYQLEDYPFRVDASEEEIDALVSRLIRDKYRHSQWDRAHPRSNSESELFDIVKRFMLAQVAAARAWRSDPAYQDRIENERLQRPKLFVFWRIYCGEELIHEYPYAERAEAERHLAELRAEHHGDYRLEQFKRCLTSGERPQSGTTPTEPV